MYSHVQDSLAINIHDILKPLEAGLVIKALFSEENYVPPTAN